MSRIPDGQNPAAHLMTTGFSSAGVYPAQIRWRIVEGHLFSCGPVMSLKAWTESLLAKVSLHKAPHTAHWGMYAAGTLAKGIQYNDDIRICILDKPLADLVLEPRCGPDSVIPQIADPAAAHRVPPALSA